MPHSKTFPQPTATLTGRRKVGTDGEAKWFEKGIMQRKKKKNGKFPRFLAGIVPSSPFEKRGPYFPGVYDVYAFSTPHSFIHRFRGDLILSSHPFLTGCSLFFSLRNVELLPTPRHTPPIPLIPSLFRRSGEDMPRLCSERGERCYLDVSMEGEGPPLAAKSIKK